MQALDLMIFVLEKAPGRDSGDCMVCGGDGAVNGSMSLRVDKKPLGAAVMRFGTKNTSL